MSPRCLFLIPTGLGETEAPPPLPPQTVEAVHRLTYFVAENPKSARAFLKAIGHPTPLRELRIERLDEHTPTSALPGLLEPLGSGDGGLLSEAGCPAVADPGALLVRAAHGRGLRVVPLVGPSAILLALMASGLEGQRFTFHGYLPVERDARARRLSQLETASERDGATQIFIEAPYRNEALLRAIVETCRSDTLLCLACALTEPAESIRTCAVASWRGDAPGIDRVPTVFLLYRSPRAR